MTSNNTSDTLVGVIGAGSFGTALTHLLAHNTGVMLYVRHAATAAHMQQTRQAAGHTLVPHVTVTDDLAAVAARCQVLFPAVPAAAFRSMLQQWAPYLQPHHMLIHGTKGLDVRWPPHLPPTAMASLTRNEVKTMSEVIQEESVVRQIGCLAGPNLAHELLLDQPAATVVASPCAAVIAKSRQLLRTPRFQVDSSTDLVGVELCGAMKNIVAIGAGCLSGLGYGENAKALLISRGVVEMAHIGRALGTSAQPFWGLAGLGDLVATCTSSWSRNHSLGYRLAQGATLPQLMETMEETAEGMHTVRAVRSLMEAYAISAPMTEGVYRILFEALDASTAVQQLLQSPIDTDIAG